MSVISNDFAGALRELRIIVGSLQAENQQLKAELVSMQKQINNISSEAVGIQNSNVMQAAVTGNQQQLQSLLSQPLTTQQAEIVRLSLNQPAEASQGFSIDQEMLQRFIAAGGNQGLSERRTGPSPLNGQQEQNLRMQRIAAQLQTNAAQHQVDRNQREQLQGATDKAAQAKRRQSNLLSSISSAFTLDDY